MNRKIALRRGTHLLAVSLLAASASVFGQEEKLAEDLRPISKKKAIEMVEVIVQLNDTALTSGLKQQFTTMGGTVKGQFDFMNGIHMRIPNVTLAALAKIPFVKFVSPDRPLQGSLDYAAQATQATAAWTAGWTGSGIGVAVIDSGFSAHPDFANQTCTASRIVYKQSFVSGDTTTTDGYGHGTHVAGIIGGNDSCLGLTSGFKGIAPRVNLVILKALDNQGKGTDSAVIAAIDKAIQLKSTHNIRVMNISLGRGIQESYTLDPLCQAVDRAWKAGIVVVVSAGNGGRDTSAGGYGTISAPGNHPAVITVGAMRHDYLGDRYYHQIATYSSKGPTRLDKIMKPDLVATGNRIAAARVGNTVLSAASTWADTNFMELSGTSMAAPVVAGAAALMIQKTPSLTPDTVKARMMKTAWKGMPLNATYLDPVTNITYYNQHDVFTVGAGYLDIAKALASTDVVATGKNANSPKVTYNSTARTVSLVNGTSLIWGDAIFGKSLVWGDSLLWGDTVLWGNSLVWGDSTVTGFGLVWGDNTNWGFSSAGAEAVSTKGDGGALKRR